MTAEPTQPGAAIDVPVTICMCTFRRPAVFDALASLARLEGAAPDKVSVLVIDNDDTDELRSKMERYAAEFPFPLSYVHAPAKNISIARNAALKGAESRWIAFIDDDETATPDWLLRLMQAREGVTAVIGRCEAVYDPALPSWVAQCDFHSNRIKGDPVNAYTSNALLDREFLKKHGITFRLELGRTGGEDTLFFREIAERGGTVIYRPEACVHEIVPPARATMAWVQRRKYRAGQIHALVCKEYAPAAFRWLAVTATAKMVFSGLMAILTIPGSVRSRAWFARAALHAGALHYRIRPTILEEYA